MLARLPIAGASVVAALVLAACGSGDDAPDRADPDPTATTEPGEQVLDPAVPPEDLLAELIGDDAVAGAATSAIDDLIADIDATVAAATPDADPPGEEGGS